MNSTLEQQTALLCSATLAWLDSHQWKGVDPFDGLNSPYAQAFVSGPGAKTLFAKLARLAILQTVKRSPIDLHSLLKIPPKENAMSFAVGALGGLERFNRQECSPEDVISRLDRMLDLSDPATGLWGYPFPWQARAFYVRPNEPNLVISSVCLRALAEGCRQLPGHLQSQRWLMHYQRAANELIRLFWKPEDKIFSYVSNDSVLVHNANLFGAEAIFAGANLNVPICSQFLESAQAAVQQTLAHQEENGRWSYGTRPHHQWADNFHTAYNLVSLNHIANSANCPVDLKRGIELAIQLGLRYYIQNALTKDDSARYYDNQTWPIETHSIAAGLIMARELSKSGAWDIQSAQDFTGRLIQSAYKDVYLGNGEFAYRKWPRRIIRTVFTRWTQAWIYWGLECAWSTLDSRK